MSFFAGGALDMTSSRGQPARGSAESYIGQRLSVIYSALGIMSSQYAITIQIRGLAHGLGVSKFF